jgi:hypothetical protein
VTSPWRRNLSVLGPPDASYGDLPRSIADARRDPVGGDGSPLVLGARASRGRTARLAAAAGRRVDRTFLAFPSLASPAYLVEASDAALSYFLAVAATVPPGVTRLALPVDLTMSLARRDASRRILSRRWRERVVVGRGGVAAAPVARTERYDQAWDHPAIADHDVVVFGASKDPNAKLTALCVDRASGVPAFSVKLPTTDVAADAVDREGRLLVELRRRLPTPLLATIPRVCDLVRFDGRLGLVTTALGGVPGSSSYLRWRHTASSKRVAADFEATGAWLGSLQAATVGARAAVDADAGTTDALLARFAREPGIEDDVRALGAVVEVLARETTSRTVVHGDLWHGNLLCDDGRVVGVVDWERASMSGEPFRDIVRFAIVYASYLDRHTTKGARVAGHRGLRSGVPGAGVRFGVDGQGWFPTLFRGFVREGFARVGLEPDRWREGVLAGVAEIAATTDHVGFARDHLELFRALVASTPTAASPRSRKVLAP